MINKKLFLLLFCLLPFSGFLQAQDQRQTVPNPWKMPLTTDGKKVYFSEDTDNGMDLKTFRPLSQAGEAAYAADKDGVYFFDSFGRFYFARLPGSDPTTFEILPGYFSRDKKAVFYHDSPIAKADPATFQPLISETLKKDLYFEKIGYPYSRDKGRVFYQDQEILKADPESFEILSAIWAKDKNSYYKHGKSVEASLWEKEKKHPPHGSQLLPFLSK